MSLLPRGAIIALRQASLAASRRAQTTTAPALSTLLSSRRQQQQVPAVRALSTSSSSRAAAGGHASGHQGDEFNTEEGFSAPIWRNSFLLLVTSFIVYRLSQTAQRSSPSHASSSGLIDSSEENPHVSSSSHDDDDDEHDGGEDTRPFLTRYIAYYTTPVDEYRRRNRQHLAAARDAAEDKLFFQEAQRPPIQRYRYTGIFEQASPHGLPVGGTVSVDDLKVKGDNE